MTTRPNPFDPWDYPHGEIAPPYRVICPHGRLLVLCPTKRCRYEGSELILRSPPAQTVSSSPFRRIRAIHSKPTPTNQL